MDLEQRLINVLSDPEDNDEKEATHLPGFSPRAFAPFAAPQGMSPAPSSSSSHSPLTLSHRVASADRD